MPAELQATLDSLKEQHWTDSRTTVFNVAAEATGHSVRLSGEVLEAAQRDAAERVIRQAAPHASLVNEMAVLSGPATPWALIKSSVSNLRRTPSNKAELTAQGLFGEPVELLKHDGRGWWLVRLSDGYLGWTVESYLSRCDGATAQGYRALADALVLAELASAYTGPEKSIHRLVGKLPFGAPVHVAERWGDMARVNWESEPPLWVAERDLLPASERPRPDADGIARTLDLMRRFMGVPYLWGGESPFGFDCSGFAQAALEFMGVRVPRDADMQCAVGQRFEGDPRPGDLLFGGDRTVDEPEVVRLTSITHVAISLGGTEFIHATQVAWGVQRNSFDPASPLYSPKLAQHLVGLRRFV